MKFENVRVMNFENAFRGVRNPKESYHLIDSFFDMITEYSEDDYEVAAKWGELAKPEYYGEAFGDFEDERIALEDKYDQWLISNGILHNSKSGDIMEVAFIGPKDMKLAQTLIKAGPEHRKFMRQIFVSVDITAPLYWWKEFDTYKVGTVANSTSTMHKMASKEITMDLFETDDMSDLFEVDNDNNISKISIEDVNFCTVYNYDDASNFPHEIITFLEDLRQKYLKTKDTRYWKELIRWLPDGWLQTRTVTMNYENLLAMCSKGQRRFHKLNEWSGIHTEVEECFIQFARTLPYAKELIFMDELNTEKLPVIDLL